MLFGDGIEPLAFTLQHSIVVKQESAYRSSEDIVAPPDYPCACGAKEQNRVQKKNRAHQSTEVQSCHVDVLLVAYRCPPESN